VLAVVAALVEIPLVDETLYLDKNATPPKSTKRSTARLG
jgi:hypothetical protein